jgi:hypothetical protein
MSLVYLTLSLLPTAAVVVLAGYLLRAVSIRVVWRKADVNRLDDKPA